MIFHSLIFYFFAAFLLGSAVMSLGSRSHVHSVLWLISSIVGAAMLFLLVKVEFIAMTLIILYVGAVAVLFLFVVMMIDSREDSNLKTCVKGWVWRFVVFVMFLVGFVSIMSFFVQDFDVQDFDVNSDQALGLIDISNILYTDYFIHFIGVGLILLVAMMGAIILTLQKNTAIRKQDIQKQTSAKPSKVVELVKNI